MTEKFFITSASRPNLVDKLDLQPVDFRAKMVDIIARATGASLPRVYFRFLPEPLEPPEGDPTVIGGIPKKWVELAIPQDDPNLPKGTLNNTPKEWLEIGTGMKVEIEGPKGDPAVRGGIPKEWMEGGANFGDVFGVIDTLTSGGKKDGKDDSKDGKDDSGKEDKDGKEGKDGKDGSDGSENKEMCDKCDTGHLDDALIIYGNDDAHDIGVFVGPFM